MKNYSIKIGWLYPELMSTYGDRGNILVLERRCARRGINTDVLRITPETKLEDIERVDVFFGGGAQDKEQEIVNRDLQGAKGKIVKRMIDRSVPGLFVCGSLQLMGNYYEPARGKRIEGLGIFDIHTVHPGETSCRCIGNITATVEIKDLKNTIIVGFENHGGRTFLGKTTLPFAKVLKGLGNNGEDGSEGVIYKNAIGTYLHGPLLPKNPEIADYLIEKALEVKYGKIIKLSPLDDMMEMKAKGEMLK